MQTRLVLIMIILLNNTSFASPWVQGKDKGKLVFKYMISDAYTNIGKKYYKQNGQRYQINQDVIYTYDRLIQESVNKIHSANENASYSPIDREHIRLAEEERIKKYKALKKAMINKSTFDSYRLQSYGIGVNYGVANNLEISSNIFVDYKENIIGRKGYNLITSLEGKYQIFRNNKRAWAVSLGHQFTRDKFWYLKERTLNYHHVGTKISYGTQSKIKKLDTYDYIEFGYQHGKKNAYLFTIVKGVHLTPKWGLNIKTFSTYTPKQRQIYKEVTFLNPNITYKIDDDLHMEVGYYNEVSVSSKCRLSQGLTLNLVQDF